MAVIKHGDLIVSNIDPAKPDDVAAELLRASSTEICVRNNRKAPTDKRVIVHMWTDVPSYVSFADHYLAVGEPRITQLHTLQIRVVSFEIRWQVIGCGSPMWATTGKITAAPGEFFPAFGIRWDECDLYSVIFPD